MISALALSVVLCSLACSTGKPPECPTKPVLLVLGGGRTANRIWEYVTTYFASKYLPNHVPYSTRGTNEILKILFDNVTLPVIEDVPKHCDRVKDIDEETGNTDVWKFIPLEKAKEKFQGTTGNVILNYCTIMIEPMVKHVKEIKQVLPYKEAFRLEAQKTLWRIKQEYVSRTEAENVTFVGLHVRRTDYLTYMTTMNRTEVGIEFYRFAINYFRSRREELGDPVFVATSDDAKWVKDNLETDDVFVINGDSAQDLVLLSSCNHTIFDYGTFGLWVGLYTEGEAVTTYQGKNQLNRILRNNPKWHFVEPKTNKMLVFPLPKRTV